jgi:hypothetical protein
VRTFTKLPLSIGPSRDHLIRAVFHLHSWPNVLKLQQILREFRPNQPHIQALFNS